MIDYLEALLALFEEREEERETPGLAQALPLPPGGAGLGSGAREGDTPPAADRPAQGGEREAAAFHGEKSGAVGTSGLLRRKTEKGASAALRWEAAEGGSGPLRRGTAGRGREPDVLSRTLERMTSTLDRGDGANWTAEAPYAAGGGAVRPGIGGGREAEGSGIAGDADSRRREPGVWSAMEAPGGRTAEERQEAARAAAERRAETAALTLERRLAAGLDRTQARAWAAPGGGPADAGAEPLSLEELDRQVRRDARRYDGVLSLY